MAINDLKLNAEKSQAILFQPLKHGVNKQPEVCVEVAGRRIALSTSVRNLGVVFDSRLSMEEQVAQTAKSCYYQLRNIGQIRSSITEGACRTLVHALVTSRLDYGNGLLYGILQRLQRIQNCAARLITRTPKYEHITPVLRRLYLLPVRQRTLFKLLVLTYCAVNATAPNYLVQLLHRRNVSRTLRSGSSTDILSVPPSRTVTHGDRCFTVASPTLWNNLPVSLKPGVHTNDFAPIYGRRAKKLGHASLATVFRHGRLTFQPILWENLESPVLRCQPITTAVITDACLNTRWHHGAYTSAVLREPLGVDRVVTVYVVQPAQ